MCKDWYVLNPSHQYVIYGLNGIAKEWIKKANSNGYSIKGILDRNAADIEVFENIKAYTVEEFPFEDKAEVIAVVFLQNVMLHESVYQMLKKAGFEKIVYCPLKDKENNAEEFVAIRDAYNELIRFEEEEKVVLWIPASMCFACDSDYVSKWGRSLPSEVKEIKKRYIDGRNIQDVQPYQMLFDYLEGRREECDLYFASMYPANLSKAEKERILKDRRSVYRYMENSWIEGLHHFTSSPLEGVFDGEKFIVEDGCHRAVYLTHCKNMKKLPVRLKKEDAEKLQSYIQEVQDESL